MTLDRICFVKEETLQWLTKKIIIIINGMERNAIQSLIIPTHEMEKKKKKKMRKMER